MAGLAIFLSACTTPEPPVAADTTKTTWFLDADTESDTSAIISRGMTQDHVRTALGSPNRIQRNRKSEKKEETWKYRRKIDGPLALTTMHTGTRIITVKQPRKLVDVVIVEFAEQVVVNVRVSREPEQITPGTPPGS